MEKSATTLIIKAEPHHGGESKPAATVDPEALECPVCFHTLKPPVLQSILVDCSNAMYGCTAVKILYHEKEDHETKCSSKAGCGLAGSAATQPVLLHHGLPADYSSTLVTEKVSSITISVTGGEKKKITSTESSSMGSVVRLGPCGGAGGDASWEMDMRGVNRIVRVVIRHGGAVDAISVLYERDGREEWTDRWGGNGGKHSEIRLQQDEYLTSVKGHYGRFGNFVVIRSLAFVGNHRSFGPYGKEEGVPFELPAAGGGKILGFHARSGSLLDALGTFVEMH